MGRLPDHAPALTSSLGDTGPAGNTPTIDALTGGTDYCAQFQAQHPDERCVVVLVTDGQPNGCGLSSNCGGGQGGGNDCVDPNSEAELTPIAAAGQTNGVLTFTIGMAGVTADGFALLDAIAIAG
jgi:Mg-chelatase subunit ChlD